MGIFSSLNPLALYETQSEDLDFIKTAHAYKFKNKKGTVVSKLNFYDYKIKDFDWVLIANVETKQSHRGKGLASKLINELYADISKNNKGVYLFVKHDNTIAISLYKKLKFDTIKKYTLKDGEYIIMGKGSADKKQFNGRNFS